jgi:hypothetical protein
MTLIQRLRKQIADSYAAGSTISQLVKKHGTDIKYVVGCIQQHKVALRSEDAIRSLK